jgi:mRNA-degrading endonuclease toxin of MazEF toxin-antitoxin module
MRVNRGDVVRVDWPYSDRTGSKVRPTVVVQVDSLNHLIADTILVLISRTRRAVGTTEVALDPAVETGCGLRYPSVVSCNNLLTLDQGLIAQIIGRLSATAIQQIDDRLKAVLGLP